MELKLVRLLLGENGQPCFDKRRMKKASSLDDALKQLDRISGTEDSIFAAHNRLLNETDKKSPQSAGAEKPKRKHSAESIISNNMPASSLKESVSINAEGGRIEKVLCSPRSLMDAETRDETTLVTEETGLLEGPT